jgi:hypothetical protein
MFSKIQGYLQRLKYILSGQHAIDLANEQKLLTGKMLTQINKQLNSDNIQDYDFRVFSQWGDDGIIQYIINKIENITPIFIEFGVENYTEANTRFLLMNNNWKGLIMDGSEANMNFVRSSPLFWQYDLNAKTAFITAENINELITEAGFAGKIGILHIDIDGNDYWVWKNIETVQPDVVIMEYNSVFGIEKAWTTPYRADFFRTKAHSSNLYFGASLLALCDLAKEKGYEFIGTNLNGNNAYFVKKEYANEFKIVSPEEGYTISRFTESRNEKGDLNYLREENRLNALKGMPIWNVRTDGLEKI